jgi:hypothetical protein
LASISLLVTIPVMSTTDNDLRPFGAVLAPASMIAAIMIALDNHDLAVTAIPISVPMMFPAFANPDGHPSSAFGDRPSNSLAFITVPFGTWNLGAAALLYWLDDKGSARANRRHVEVLRRGGRGACCRDWRWVCDRNACLEASGEGENSTRSPS